MHLLSNHLYIVSTPIGNLDDITLRALEVLKKSDIILCEDTRRSLKLLNHYKIKKKLVSDPGRLLVNECIENFIKVTPVPGVSSITSALSVSGFSDKFLFYGFLPKTENELEKVLFSLSKSSFTQIFFISSKKLNFYIRAIKKFYLGRKILIAKEITKIHEAFIRDKIDELKIFKNTIKGELTIVISENESKIRIFDEVKVVNKIKKYLKTYTLKDTVNLILETEDINKKKVYDLCLQVKNEKNN